jgi:signal transduction histidine kinase
VRERIMFVDDDPRLLGGLRRALSGQPWDMEFVNTAEKAEAALDEGCFDVMVVDIRMPGTSGLDLLKQVKSSERTRDTEVIVLTGMDGADLKRKALDLGAYDFLNKPVVREEMIARLQGALRLKASLNELREKNAILRKQLIQSQKMEVVGLLAAGVAHDLNNILTVISGYADLATRKYPAQAGGGVLEAVGKIRAASLRAGRITRQILNVSRHTAAIGESCVLAPMLEECVETLRTTVSPGIRIELDHGNVEGHVHADSSQMYQVFMNLIINAVQAMGDSGVLTVRLQRGESGPAVSGAESSFPPGRHMRVDITDTGPGMDEETKKRIFEPFFTTKGTKGTGLGLPVTGRIVANYAGCITVESSPGKGSTFTVYLPAAEGREVPVRRDIPQGSPV